MKKYNAIVWAVVILLIAFFVPVRVEITIKDKTPAPAVVETDSIK